MTRRLVLVVLTVVLAWIYMFVVINFIGHAEAFSIPSWWNSLFSSRDNAALPWMVTVNTLAVFAASLPFAFLIARLYGRSGVWVALILTVSIGVLFGTWTRFESFGHDPVRFQVVALFDAVKFIGILPALVWVFRAWPSNNRIERRVSDKGPSTSVGASGAHAER